MLETLLRQPNRYMSGYEFRRAMMLQACLFGNSFALINRTRGGELLELMPLDIESVSLDVTGLRALLPNPPVRRRAARGHVPPARDRARRALGRVARPALQDERSPSWPRRNPRSSR
jgi:hypothetical protein